MENETLPQTADRIVIETLALSEAELLERVAELESDNRALRETLKLALDMLYRTNRQLDRATARMRMLLQEIRDQREQAA